MKVWAIWIVALVGAVLSAQGCVGRVIGEGAEKTLGPKGVYWEEIPFAASRNDKVLEPYTRFVLGGVGNGYGHNVPQEFFSLLIGEFDKACAAGRLPDDPGGKTLGINVNVIHYEEADMTDNILGPLEQVVARVTFVDKDSGKVLAVGNAVGRTGSTLGRGPDWKARGLAKALVKWIKDYRYKKEEG